MCKNTGDTGVSIHASVKDATQRRAALIRAAGGFNPRICKRCDFTGYAEDGYPIGGGFNPRICKRCDIGN